MHAKNGVRKSAEATTKNGESGARASSAVYLFRSREHTNKHSYARCCRRRGKAVEGKRKTKKTPGSSGSCSSSGKTAAAAGDNQLSREWQRLSNGRTNNTCKQRAAACFPHSCTHTLQRAAVVAAEAAGSAHLGITSAARQKHAAAGRAMGVQWSAAAAGRETPSYGASLPAPKQAARVDVGVYLFSSARHRLSITAWWGKNSSSVAGSCIFVSIG